MVNSKFEGFSFSSVACCTALAFDDLWDHFSEVIDVPAALFSSHRCPKLLDTIDQLGLATRSS